MKRARNQSSLVVKDPDGRARHKQIEFGEKQSSLAFLKKPVDCAFSGGMSDIEWEYPARLVMPLNWAGHIPFAFWLVGVTRPHTLVELGVHSGNSYCAFLQAIRMLDLHTQSFGIDHWKGDDQTGFYGEDVYRELRAYHDTLYGSFSTLLRSSFDEALAHFADGSIDLLHIDGFHTYDAVSRDFSSWLKKMSSRGTVLFHDINVREGSFGVWRFWDELSSQYPSFALLHSHGLGIAYVGTETVNEQLEFLLSKQTNDELRRIRSYFARLGASIVDRYQARQLDVAVKHAEARIGHRLDETISAAENLTGLFDETGKHAENLTLQRDSVRQHADQCEKLNRQLHDAKIHAEAERERLAFQLDETKATLASTQARIAKAGAQNEMLSLMSRQQTAIISRLQRELIDLNNTHQRLRIEYESVLGSTSWRLTKPARLIMDKLYRVAGFLR